MLKPLHHGATLILYKLPIREALSFFFFYNFNGNHITSMLVLFLRYLFILIYAPMYVQSNAAELSMQAFCINKIHLLTQNLKPFFV